MKDRLFSIDVDETKDLGHKGKIFLHLGPRSRNFRIGLKLRASQRNNLSVGISLSK